MGGNSREKLYQELGLEFFQQRHFQTVQILQEKQKSISVLSVQVTTPDSQLVYYKIIKQYTCFHFKKIFSK